MEGSVYMEAYDNVEGRGAGSRRKEDIRPVHIACIFHTHASFCRKLMILHGNALAEKTHTHSHSLRFHAGNSSKNVRYFAASSCVRFSWGTMAWDAHLTQFRLGSN